MNSEYLATLGTLLALIIKGIFDERNRRMDLQERRLQGTAVIGKIDENTKISKDAFDVANHVNEKIANTNQTANDSMENVLQELAKLRQESQTTRGLVQVIHDK